MSGRSRGRNEGDQPTWRVKPRFGLGGVLAGGLSPNALLIAFLVLTFAIGGGSRSDIASLIVLRPVSALVLGYGLAGLTLAQVRSFRWLFWIALACVLVAAVSLVPLPPSLFYALPGRGVIAEVDAADGLAGVWRPMSLAPAQSWNALWAMMPPLAVLVLGVRMSARERRSLLAIVLGLGLVSAAIAAAQVFADPHGLLYFYDDTNNGMAVGLFANRNHQAVFLASLLPMLAVWAGERGAGPVRSSGGKAPRFAPRVLVALVVGLTLIPLILITGSRAGVLAGLVALLSLPLVVRPGRATGNGDASGVAPAGRRRMRWMVAGAAFAMAVVLVTATMVSGRAEALDRLFGTSASGDLRVRILPVLRAMIVEYMPIGSGPGAFKPVYRVHEPDGLLAQIIVNHAHNDWFEVVIASGLPGLLIVVGCVGAWLIQAGRLITATSQRGLTLARLGLVVIALLAMGSISDYPLRVPSLACLFAVCALWACRQEEVDG